LSRGLPWQRCDPKQAVMQPEGIISRSDLNGETEEHDSSASHPDREPSRHGRCCPGAVCPEIFEGVPSLNDPRSSPPIFVTGVPRSGTTLLAAMLGAHPRLVCGPENYFFQCLADVGARALCRRADWPKAAIDFLFSIQYGSHSKRTDVGES